MSDQTCFSVGNGGNCGASCPVFADGECTEPQEIAREFVVAEYGDAADDILAKYPCFDEIMADIPAPPKAITDIAMLGGSGYVRNENDFYPTEEAASQVAVDFVKLHFPWVKTVWEPACGAGDMQDVFAKAFLTIGTDKFPQDQEMDSFDFLADKPEFDFDGAFTNPPYGDLAEEFAKKCVEYTRTHSVPTGLLMRLEYDSAVTRNYLFGACPEFYAKVALLWRPRWVAGSTGSPRHNYAWYFWAPGAHGDAKIYYAKKPSLA